jgi:hypothetical protein
MAVSTSKAENVFNKNKLLNNMIILPVAGVQMMLTIKFHEVF